MVKLAVSKIIKLGKANTRYLTLPANLVQDPAFPFSEDEDIKITIDPENQRLIVEKID